MLIEKVWIIGSSAMDHCGSINKITTACLRNPRNDHIPISKCVYHNTKKGTVIARRERKRATWRSVTSYLTV